MFTSGRIIRPQWTVSAILSFVCCLLFVWGGDSFAAAKNASEQRTGLRWAFGAIAQEKDGLKLRPVGEKAVLTAGDKLKMMVELKEKRFVYVVYRNAQGELSQLFPRTPEQDPDRATFPARYFIPGQDAWFELDDHPGTETFYLIASDRKLNQLEYLIEQYRSAESAKKASLAEQAIAEIEGIEQDRRELTAYAERTLGPASSRGFERAQGQDPSDISVFAQEISCPATCLRTFVIEHR